MTYSLKNATYIFFLLMSIEFGGDSILRVFNINIGLIDITFKFLISFTALILLASFGFKSTIRLPLLLPLLIFIGVILIGLLNGLLINNIVNALKETSSFLFIALFLSFSVINKPLSVLEVESFLKVFVYIVSFKVLIYIVASYLVYDTPSWKILLKQSPLLLIPISVLFSKISLECKFSKSNILLLVLMLVCVVFAQARMLFLALTIIFLFYFLNRRVFSKGLLIIGLISASLWIYWLVTNTGLSSFNESLYAGKLFEDGLDYRLTQLDVIINRLVESPLLGVGFGHYTPGYLTYGELSKPYLLELDILNFISKIGLIMTFFYVMAYVLLFRLIRSISDNNVRRLAKSLFVSLIALLIYSTGQSFHQAYAYWSVLAFIYGFVVSHLRVQNKSVEYSKKRSLGVAILPSLNEYDVKSINQ
jgi:hypothetical protein